jgi:SIR2-like domain
MGVLHAADQTIEPPYGIILDELRSGNAIPFLGAAASRVVCSADDSVLLPSGAELASILADDANFPSDEERDRTDLAKVSSYYVDGSNRGALRRKLHRVFADTRHRCNDLHRFLAAVANNLMVVTTNYDTLLEQAFIELGKPYDVIVYPADNQEYGNGVLWWPHGANEPRKLKSNQIDIEDLRNKNLIYKIHGSVRLDADKWDSFVITEEDYVRFLSRMTNAVPAALREYFSKRAFLFLGYGLKDWNMRVLLKEVSVSEITSWAILYKPSIFERKLWERRKVDIFNLKLEDFVATMRARLGP